MIHVTYRIAVLALLLGLTGCTANQGTPENMQAITTTNTPFQITQTIDDPVVSTTGAAEEFVTDPIEEVTKATDFCTEIQEAHSHKYDATTIASSCTEKGYTIYSCSCGDSYIGNETAALGHCYTEHEVAPTADDRGYTLYTCASCGSSYMDNWTDILPAESQPMHEHNYTTEQVDATCQARGYTLYACACGDSYKDNYTDKERHTMVTAEIVYQTYESDGYHRLECCYGCGETETIILPRLTEYLDTAALEAYGRLYAEETYGYIGNTNCTASNGAGFYSPIHKRFTTMEDGKRAVRACVDSHHRLYASYGNDVPGSPINVYLEPTEDPTVFLVYIYYGGEC